ncbi:hypothetical protein Pint_27334 [Pistacia integerrima]|uniref:Uncharacterized protein n=1 Tax=Pistacia integerrima TaxID=434235 RepID=A0ACC0YQM5_9ROSI|nr:hypothetical protein Pint_27334 [Pistacia integerrima]
MSLADKFECIVHGKLYKMADAGIALKRGEVYVSYGGLLMMLNGDPCYMSRFELDKRLLLLARKL